MSEGEIMILWLEGSYVSVRQGQFIRMAISGSSDDTLYESFVEVKVMVFVICVNFPISRFLIPVANFNLKLRASVSTELRLMLEMLTKSALPKSFQQFLLHKDINLDPNLVMWLLFILNISDLSYSAMLWYIPCF